MADALQPLQIPSDSCDCEPFVYMPAWWSSFLFHLISPRQLAVYTYIAMRGVPDGVSRPTVRQIQEDMGLLSDSVVFEALRTLEQLALLRRMRFTSRNGQNVYSRPSCQSTLLRLLEAGRIDAGLRAVTLGKAEPASSEVTQLARDGLTSLLGKDFAVYESADPVQRKTVLIDLLRRSLDRRKRDPDACVCLIDEQRELEKP